MWEKPQVFLSYAREDQIPVSKLYRKLREEGLRPWMDVEDIRPGEPWKTAIGNAIANSAFFLALLTPVSAAKPGELVEEMKSARELRAKKDAPLRLIPVRLERCEVPATLQDLQWIDLFDPDGWTRLVHALKPRRRLLPLAAGAAAAALLAGAAIWIYERPCSFASARVSDTCSSKEAFIGATFWRYRKSANADPPAVRSTIQPPAEAGTDKAAGQITPLRLGPADHLKYGDRFYLSIEGSRAGYIYVVNREEYANGRTGPPELIFPTRRTREGNNRVDRSALVRLPDALDNPPFFQIAGGTASDYRGELYTVILLPKPIEELALAEDHVPVGQARFEAWQKEWLRPSAQVTSPGREGVITVKEAEAQRALERVRQTMDDPWPALMYRVAPGKDDGVWVDFRLRVDH